MSVHARKPIQSSTAICAVDGVLVRTVIVICDDGTVWRMSDNEAGVERWEPLPPIPPAIRERA